MLSFAKRLVILSAVAAAGLVASRTAEAGPVTYLSLGDSLAFGVGANNTPTDVSNGDRGFVGRFADFLAPYNAGVRPDVLNLGISGETSESFFTGGGGIVGPTSPPRNTNYAGGVVPQNDALLAAVASAAAAGRDIGYVSISLGSNDLFAMVLDPAFQTGTPDQQAVILGQTLTKVATNLSILLTELKAIPGAEVFVLGTYNPYPAVPGHPLAGIAGVAISLLNGVLQERAGAFNAKYVDTYSPFVGREAELTYIASSGTDFNVHPTEAGYAAIARQLELAAVPEPGGLVLMGTGLATALGFARRRRRAA